MKILITGKHGQLGQQLLQDKPRPIDLVAYDRDSLDIVDRDQLRTVVVHERPDVIVNAAAYTAVDRAESDADQAYAVNTVGVENIAQVCADMGVQLIHVSTDFVFNGQQSTPYKSDDSVDPLGVYGASKAAGEQALQAILPRAIILRTAWVYSAHGNNFMNTMLRLMNARDEIEVVADQIGAPTWTGTLSRAIYALASDQAASGIYHCTDAGTASWYDFAVAIYEDGVQNGLISNNREVLIKPIAAKEYPTPAKRPNYSVLDTSKLLAATSIDLYHWREILRGVMREKSVG